MKDKLKTYVCKYCKNKYDMLVSKRAKRSMTALKSCCTSPDCMFKAYQVLKEKQEKQKRREWQKRKAKGYEEIGAKKKQSQDPLQISINKIAVLLDKGKPCLARPFHKNNRIEGGHVIPISRYKSIRYHLWNIHGQGHVSNSSQKDDKLMMEGIEIRYGKERREFVESLPKLYPILKPTIAEKREWLKKANQIIRDIENKGMKYSRDEVNRILNIYK